jgi:hypothetical protein
MSKNIRLLTNLPENAPNTSLIDLPQIRKVPENQIKSYFRKRYFTFIFILFILVLSILIALFILSINFKIKRKGADESDSLELYFNDSLKNYCGRPLISPLKTNRIVRIINGDITNRDYWPWIVSLRYKLGMIYHY